MLQSIVASCVGREKAANMRKLAESHLGPMAAYTTEENWFKAMILLERWQSVLGDPGQDG